MWCQNWITRATVHQVRDRSGESFAQHPDTDEHDDGVAVVQGLGFDQPGIPQTKNSIGLRARPSHDINLVSLDQMLAPVRQHDEHETLKARSCHVVLSFS